jgi:hypothetical protein
VLCILSICLLILHLSVAICEICLLYFTYGVCLVLSLKPGVTCVLLAAAGRRSRSAGGGHRWLGEVGRVDQRDDNVMDTGGGGVGTVATIGFT